MRHPGQEGPGLEARLLGAVEQRLARECRTLTRAIQAPGGAMAQPEKRRILVKHRLHQHDLEARTLPLGGLLRIGPAWAMALGQQSG